MDFELVIHSYAYNNFSVAQGACSDGTYAYILLRTAENGEAIIAKHSLETGKVIKRSAPIYVFHGNDMTFDTARNIIYIAHGSTEGKILTTVDPEKLTVIDQSVEIKKGAGAITYCPERDLFAISKGGKTLHILSNKLKVKNSYSREELAYTAQGMGSDSDFIYFPMSGEKDNILAVYDWNGNYITIVTLPTGWESESLFCVNGSYYVCFYHDSSAYLFKLVFEPVS